MAKRSTADEECFRILIAWNPALATSEDSPLDTSVIDYAAWLSRTVNVQIRVISTFVRPWPSTSLAKLGGKYKKWYAKESAACETAVKKALLAAGIDKRNWDTTPSVFLDGTTEVALLTKAAEDFEADLLIVHSGTFTQKGRLLSGTAVDALLNSTHLPLGMIPHTMKLAKKGVTRVNYGFVNGEQDEDVLRHAAQLAHKWHVPLRVIAFAPEFINENTLITPVADPSEISVQFREHLYATLDRARDIVAESQPSLEVETEIGSGRNWANTVDAVKWKKGDLLYVASVQLSPLERVFVGAETSQLLNFAPVPVILRSGEGRN